MSQDNRVLVLRLPSSVSQWWDMFSGDIACNASAVFRMFRFSQKLNFIFAAPAEAKKLIGEATFMYSRSMPPLSFQARHMLCDNTAFGFMFSDRALAESALPTYKCWRRLRPDNNF